MRSSRILSALMAVTSAVRAELRAATVVLAGTAVMCLAVTACSGGRHDAPPRPLTKVEQAALYDAEQLLIQECMEDKGFRIWPVPRDPVPDDRSFPYVIDDVKWATRHGYGSDIQQALTQARTDDLNQVYLRGLLPARRAAALTALNGPRPYHLLATVPSGGTMRRSAQGCTARSQAELYGDLAAWFRADAITGALDGVTVSQVIAAPAYKDAVTRWSSCMRGLGFHYASPAQTRPKFLADIQQNAARPVALEVRTAVAEANCAHSSGLSATVKRLDHDAFDRLKRRYRTAVNTHLHMEHAALPKAKSIMRAAG